MQDTGPASGLANEPATSGSALPLPHPFPDYMTCPYCGEPEVEIWCYQAAAQCYNCGGWIRNKSEINCRNAASCPHMQTGDAGACPV